MTQLTMQFFFNFLKTDYVDGLLQKNAPGVFYSWMCCLASRHYLCKWTKIKSQLVSKSLTLSEETRDIIPSTNTSHDAPMSLHNRTWVFIIYNIQYTEGSLSSIASHLRKYIRTSVRQVFFCFTVEIIKWLVKNGKSSNISI